MPPLSPLERAEAFLEQLRAGRNWDFPALDGLEVESASPGRVVSVLTTTAAHANRYGTVHGGCIATLVDVLGSVALVTEGDRGGVSVTINTTYVAPAPVGKELRIVAEVARSGKAMGTALVTLSVGGATVAHGTHVKALVPHSDLSALWAHTAERREALQRGRPQEQRGGGGAGADGGGGQFATAAAAAARTLSKL